MIDVKRLRFFCEVARQGSFSAAAEALHYSQPAISHHVSRLELELGTKLLERSSRGLTLTTAGTTLLAHSAGILDRINDAEVALAEISGERERRVRLGGFATGSATLLADAISAVQRDRPGIRFTLLEDDPDDCLQHVRAGDVDLGLVFDSTVRPLGNGADITIRYVYEDTMLVALPADHHLAGSGTVPLEALREDDWIGGGGYETPCSVIMMDACERAGFEPRVAFNSGDYQVVQRLVATGVGVALIPQLALRGSPPDIVALAADPPAVPRRIGIATLTKSRPSRSLAAFVAALERVCAEADRVAGSARS